MERHLRVKAVIFLTFTPPRIAWQNVRLVSMVTSKTVYVNPATRFARRARMGRLETSAGHAQMAYFLVSTLSNTTYISHFSVCSVTSHVISSFLFVTPPLANAIIP